MFRLVLSAGIALVMWPAAGHDRWFDGAEVPIWVRQACCGVADSHHLQPNQVHIVQGGYQVDGYKDLIPEKKMEPSPDGEFWIFYRNLPNGDQSVVYCFFGPLSGV
jgi:hypothetical protein